MKPKYPDIAYLMFKLDAEMGEMNAVQGRISELKDKIWTMMRDANLSHVCYDGNFSATARGRALVVKHNSQNEAER